MAGENITFKDIGLLTQKASVAGTEKLPVSDTEYITVSQITDYYFIEVEEDGLYLIDEDLYIGFYIDEQGMHSIPSIPAISTNISTDASSDTKTTSPHAVKTYVDDVLGDIETLLEAI